MLQLFHSIFGHDRVDERYPGKLVDMAIDRAVDGTDQWLRGLSGYRRKLRPAVLNAIDHVVTLVDSFDEVLELSRDSYADHPLLQLFFISTAQMESLLKSDPTLTSFHRNKGHAAQPVWALLTMECDQRQTFGTELRGETIVRDVSQITVSLSAHRLLDPTTDLTETRRMLKRRAFDHLLTLALTEITLVKDVREELVRHRNLLQSKLDFLQRGDWGFHTLVHEVPPSEAVLQEQIDNIESQLVEVGGDDRYIEKNLEILIDVLTNAERQLWAQPLPLIVDSMGIKRNDTAEDASKLVLTELNSRAGRQLIASLVKVPPCSADWHP